MISLDRKNKTKSGILVVSLFAFLIYFFLSFTLELNDKEEIKKQEILYHFSDSYQIHDPLFTSSQLRNTDTREAYWKTPEEKGTPFEEVNMPEENFSSDNDRKTNNKRKSYISPFQNKNITQRKTSTNSNIRQVSIHVLKSGRRSNTKRVSRTPKTQRSSVENKFQFLVMSRVCNLQTQVLVIVCSAPENILRRNMIRTSWASLEDSRLLVLFLVGLPNNNTHTVQYSLEQESLEYNDLIQADFIDVYNNLSLKSIAMLQWTSSNCQTTRFLVKADDDVFLNTPLLVRDLSFTRHRRFIMGNVVAGAQPSRNPASKWFTPTASYAENFYPKYVSGAAYVISGDLIYELYVMALSVQVFWIEDVFITGVLAVNIADVQHIYNGKFDIIREIAEPCVLPRHILRHLSDPTDMINLWTLIKSPPTCSPYT